MFLPFFFSIYDDKHLVLCLKRNTLGSEKLPCLKDAKQFWRMENLKFRDSTSHEKIEVTIMKTKAVLKQLNEELTVWVSSTFGQQKQMSCKLSQ